MREAQAMVVVVGRKEEQGEGSDSLWRSFNTHLEYQ
jgi:hypothetical protein